jgi:hypothetical protein
MRRRTIVLIAVALTASTLWGCSNIDLSDPQVQTLALRASCAHILNMLDYSKRFQLDFCGVQVHFGSPTQALAGLPREPHALEGGAAVAERGIEGGGTIVLRGIATKGSVKGNKLPKWVEELRPDLRAVRTGQEAGRFDVAVNVAALDKRAETPKGKRKKLGSKKASVDPDDGGALAEFASLPAPKSHYRVEVKISGGTVKDSRVLFMASATAAGLTRVSPAAGLQMALRAYRAAAAARDERHE